MKHRRIHPCSPLGKLLSPNIKRWTSNRKAAVVAAVKIGAISREKACSSYQLSEEELLAWERAFDMYGSPGLRALALQHYRRLDEAKSRGADPLAAGRPS